MNKSTLKSESLLLLTAAIWGFAFIAQRAGMEHVGPFTFNAIRFAMGSLVLVPLVILRNKRSESSGPISTSSLRPFLHSSIHPIPHSSIPSSSPCPSIAPSPHRAVPLSGPAFAGAALFLGASFQQWGIVYTTAGKAGFITGLYVIIVPILGLFWRQRPRWGTWIGAILAAIGMYLLSFSGTLTVNVGDLLVLASAFFWAVHVHIVGWLTGRMDSIRLACLQFAVCSLFSVIGALAMETFVMDKILAAAIPILYAGLLSTGVAYTLQVVAQKDVPSSNAAIIMSLEAVFAVVGGWLFLAEIIPLRGLAGCGIMLAGMILAQVFGTREKRAPLPI
ncbi:MAG TPA: DMT family transporter [bacterium]|nr:DMT family transporter [bacterium]